MVNHVYAFIVKFTMHLVHIFLINKYHLIRILITYYLKLVPTNKFIQQYTFLSFFLNLFLYLFLSYHLHLLFHIVHIQQSNQVMVVLLILNQMWLLRKMNTQIYYLPHPMDYHYLVYVHPIRPLD
jgi:hypothetical protein